MKLSVMVISHNQAHLIRRCLDSILAQKITAPWEIVISDDASTDDTWEVIQEYVKRYPESKKSGEIYVPRVRAYQINSSDYNPTVTSDRCAANKANVYMHAEGEYCVNIDADDYLKSDDIYAYLISQLESHPECSVAVQNIWYQNDGEPIEDGHTWHSKGIWKENEILDFAAYCKRGLFTSNPAFMMRRDKELNPMEKYGLLFDDLIISTHHILRGKIICSERAEYVYVQYRNSIWNSIHDTDDSIIRGIMPTLIYLKFYPNHGSDILHMETMSIIRSMKRYIKQCPLTITEGTRAYAERLHSPLVDSLLKGNLKARWMARWILFWMLIRSKYEFAVCDKVLLRAIK